MKSNYNDCLNRLLKDEGGYTNDPSDSGGPTNFGITLSDYRRYINNRGQAIDVKNMTVDQAKVIYKDKYWNALNCDTLPSGLDYTVFDYAVNSGLGRPRKALQQFKDETGVQLIEAINNERTTFLRDISGGKNAKFLKGWLARVKRVNDYSLVLAKKKDNTTGPVVGAGTIGIGATISHYWHDYQSVIIISTMVLAAAIAIAVHYYRNKK